MKFEDREAPREGRICTATGRRVSRNRETEVKMFEGEADSLGQSAAGKLHTTQ